MFHTLLLAFTLTLAQLVLPAPTGNNATLILTAEGRAPLAAGDTLLASNAEGTLVGYRQIPPPTQAMAMALWEDDPFTAVVDGYVQGDPLRFGTWDGEAYRPFLVSAYEEWSVPGITTLVGIYEQDAIYLTSDLLLSQNTVGFVQPSITVAQGAQVNATVAVVFEGPGSLAGLQVDIGSSVAPASMLPSGWSVSTSALGPDSTRFIATGVEAPLAPGVHNLFRLSFTPTTSGTIALGNPIGSLSGQAGEDAALALGAGTLNYTLIPRGDATGDNRANIADLVYAIDAALGAQPFHAAIDLHPFPSGNGSIDVRDVVVVAEALVSGQWPDGLPVIVNAPRPGTEKGLPAQLRALTAGSASKARGTGETTAAHGSEEVATLFLSPQGGQTYLSSDVPLRALQGRLVGYDDSLSAIPQATLSDDTSSDDYSFLFYRMGSEAMEAPFGVAPGTLNAEDFADLVGVTLDGETVTLEVAVATPNEDGSPQDEQPLSLFPNPTTGLVKLSRTASGAVYDLLGRRILTFEDADRLDFSSRQSGVYLVVIDGQTHRITVVQ